MNEPENKSTPRVALIVVGVIAVLAILGGAVYALILANQPKPVANDNKPAPTRTVPTTEDLDKGINNLKQTAEVEKTQRAKAQAALDDHLKRIKLTN